MSFTDPIGDMITRIRNAQLRTLYNVKIPNSKFRARILEVLKQEGYISNYKLLSDSKDKSSLVVDLKYHNGQPVIKEIKRVSKPGRRIYKGANELKSFKNGYGTIVVSTNKGVIANDEAYKLNVGGEVLCSIW